MYNVQKIRALMNRKMLNQKQLAEEADLTTGTVSRLMNSKRCSQQTIKKIAQALEVQPVDLLDQSQWEE